MQSTGQRVTLLSIFEPNAEGVVTVMVAIMGKYNPGLLFDRQVFGVAATDLVECDVPPEGPGPVLTSEEADANIDAIRVMLRPDLFEMGDDGKAVRKH